MPAEVPLPTADQIRADIQRMVDVGPRLTGSPAHDEFCRCVEDEMRAAGLQIAPYDVYDHDWHRTGPFSLEILDGDAAGTIDVATSYVRSIGTPPGGVTGPLVSAAGFPTTNVVAALLDPNAPSAAVREWVASVPPGTYRNIILLIELATPGELSAGVFTALSTHLQWDGHDEDDWSALDYSRAWMGPWLDLTDLVPLGVSGVVLTTRASIDVLRGNNSLHIARPRPDRRRHDRQREWLADELFGPATLHLVEHAGCPVAIIPPHGDFGVAEVCGRGRRSRPAVAGGRPGLRRGDPVSGTGRHGDRVPRRRPPSSAAVSAATLLRNQIHACASVRGRTSR